MMSKSIYKNITKASALFKNDELAVESLSVINTEKHTKISFNDSYIDSKVIEVY